MAHMPNDTGHPLILHIISGDLWAGAEVMSSNLLQVLAQDDRIRLTVILLNGGKLECELRRHNINVYVIDESTTGSLRTLWQIIRFCRTFRPDIIHTHRQKENVLGSLAALAAGAESVRTVHGFTETPDLGWRLDKRLFQFMDKLVGNHIQKVIVAVSDDLRQKIQCNFRRRPVVVIENGINVESTLRQAANATSFETSGSSRDIGIIGRLVPVKRHDKFIAAAMRLLDQDPEKYAFHIIGDGPLLDQIAEQVEQSGFTSQISLHGFQEQIPPIIAKLDAIVVCSDHEGVPMIVLEAAVLGTPLVMVPLPSLSRVAESLSQAYLCDSASIDSIADGIANAVKTIRRSEHEVGADWFYTSQRMAAEYALLYADLTAAPMDVAK